MEKEFAVNEKLDVKTHYKVNFNSANAKTLTISLNDINRIDIENEGTFNRVPYLAHNLDLIVYFYMKCDLF